MPKREAISDDDEEFRQEVIQDFFSDDDEDEGQYVEEENASEAEQSAYQDAEDSVEEYDDDLFKGEEDRMRLLGMSQLEREQILYDREQRRNKWLSRLEALNQKKGRSQRSLPKDKASTALEDIRDRRSNKSSSTKQSMSHIYSDYDSEHSLSDEESLVPAKRAPKATKPLKKQKTASSVFLQTQTPLDLKTVKELQIRRNMLERIHLEPFFEEYIHHMFVRVSVRQSVTTGKPVYHMARVEGVSEAPSPYPFGNGSSHLFLRLSIGKDVRQFSMLRISNKGIQQDLMDSWARVMQKQKCSILTCEEALKLKIDREILRKNYRYSHEDIQSMVERTRAAQIAQVNITKEITNLELSMNEAIQKQDHQAAERLRGEIETLKIQHQQNLDKKYGSGASTEVRSKRPKFDFSLLQAGDQLETFDIRLFLKNLDSPTVSPVTEISDRTLLERLPLLGSISQEMRSLTRSHAFTLSTLDPYHLSASFDGSVIGLQPSSFSDSTSSKLSQRSSFERVLSIEEYTDALET